MLDPLWAIAAGCGFHHQKLTWQSKQKRPVGAEVHPFGWGKHRVRLYTARTCRGYAPAPPAPKGEKSAVQREARHAKSAPQ